MAAMLQGIGSASVISPSTSSDHYNRSRFSSSLQSLPVIRCEGRLILGSVLGDCRTGRFVTKAAATTQIESASTTKPSKPGHELLLFEALREGLEEEMERDSRVCVMGEDVGHYGGSYKVTKGLAKKYGDLRVLDTPIAENSFTGMAIGAGMTGLRLIVEGMNMGFLLLAFNQISDNCGMPHYTSGGQFKIPVVTRGPGGVGRQLGAERSQRLESFSIHSWNPVGCLLNSIQCQGPNESRHPE